MTFLRDTLQSTMPGYKNITIRYSYLSQARIVLATQRFFITDTFRKQIVYKLIFIGKPSN